jgi:hypothetical protein
MQCNPINNTNLGIQISQKGKRFMSKKTQPLLELVKQGKSPDAKVLPEVPADKLPDDELQNVDGGFDPPYACSCPYGNN